MEELVGDCIAELEAQGYTRDVKITRALEMRYLGQNYELELPVDFERFAAENTEELWRAFHDAHKARFGFSIPGEIIEIVNYLATAVSLTPKPEVRPIAKATGAPVAVARRAIGFPDGRLEVPIYRRDQLAAGHLIDGPAVIEEAASVTVVNPGQRLAVDRYGHLVIDAVAA
jgi:N-methylhydantoinase A